MHSFFTTAVAVSFDQLPHTPGPARRTEVTFRILRSKPFLGGISLQAPLAGSRIPIRSNATGSGTRAGFAPVRRPAGGLAGRGGTVTVTPVTETRHD